MRIFYSMAHSNPNGSPGTHNLTGVCERTVSRNAYGPFKVRCEAEGHTVESFSGPLNPKIRLINSAIRKAAKLNEQWASVALHFNNTPTKPCESCKKIKHYGVPCPHCGAAATKRWRFGHTAMIFKNSWASMELACRILHQADSILDWSERRPPILMPDSRYNAIWPRVVFRPSALIEIGFGCDPRFSKWISEESNHLAYGMLVAEGVCRYAQERKNVSIENWHK